MAILKFPPNPYKNNYRNPDAIRNVIHYILEPSKTPNSIIGAVGLDCSCESNMIILMESLQSYYRKTSGKHIHHFIVSFSKDEIKKIRLKDYIYIGYSITDFFDNQYQIVFALHENTNQTHFHFALNPVNFNTGNKIHWQKKDSNKLNVWIQKVVSESLFQ